MRRAKGFRWSMLALVVAVIAAAVPFLSVGSSTQSASAQVPGMPWMNPSLPAGQRADLLLDAMTLDQKISQMVNVPGYNADLDEASGGDPDDNKGCDIQRLGRKMPGIPSLGIPTMRFANGGTGIRGGDCVPEPTATGLPTQSASGATFNPGLMLQWGRVLGREVKAWGHSGVWGPGMNMIRTPWGGRNWEYISEDPYVTGRVATDITMGIQENGSHATLKHYAGNETEYYRERWTSTSRIPSRAMHEIYLLPFEMAIKDGNASSVMCGYPMINYEFGCSNHELETKVLRDQWNFDGYVISDRRAMHSTVPSLLAGTGWELDQEPQYYTPELLKAAIDSGQITEATLDGLLRPRYLKMFELGNFDNPVTTMDLDKINYTANNRVARQIADESITLLKNENHRLPLRFTEIEGDIALIGPQWFAGQATLSPRNGDRELLRTVESPAEFTISPKQGLERTLGRLFAPGGPEGPDAPPPPPPEDAPKVIYNNAEDMESAVDLARDSQTVIVMVGDDPRENWDKSTLHLPTVPETPDGSPVPENGPQPVDQEELVERILEVNPKAIIVLKTQGAILMPWLKDAQAVVEAFFPGQADGDAVADLLFGLTNPSGRLQETWPNTAHEAAFASDAQWMGLREDNGLGGGTGGFEPRGLPQLVTHYTENLAMGHRWYSQTQVRPVFPFGYGLSYTTFDFRNLAISQSGSVANVSFDVINTGPRDGKEVAQVYLTLPREANEPPKRLVGYQKVDVQAGERVRVTIPIDANSTDHPMSYWLPADPESLRHWADGSWITPAGTFTVDVGGNAQDTPLRGTFALAPPLASASAPLAPFGGPVTSAKGAKAAFRGKRRMQANRKRIVKLRVNCPLSAGPRGCSGVLRATTGKAANRKAAGHKRFKLPAGRTTTVRLKLNRKTWRKLMHKGTGRMSLRLSLRIELANGSVQRTVRRITVLAPRRH